MHDTTHPAPARVSFGTGPGDARTCLAHNALQLSGPVIAMSHDGLRHAISTNDIAAFFGHARACTYTHGPCKMCQ